MTDVLEFPWTSPDETSDDGPALAAVGDRLYIAWVGSGNNHLNIMPSIDLGGGVVGFDSNAKVVVDIGDSQEVNSLGGPALTGTSDGLLLLAWTHDGGGPFGPGGASSMFGVFFDQTFNRRGFIASLDTSDDGPALTNWAAGNGINTAWRGSGNPNLNVMQGMDTFTKSTSDETSPYRPALCTSQWPNFTIHMAWTGEGDGELNVMHCNNDNPFVGAPPVQTRFDSATKVNIPTETSPSAPAIAALGKGLYLCWRGKGNDQVNILGMHQGSGDRAKRTSERTTEHHPAIAPYRGKLFVAWTGTDDHLNVGQVAPLYDPVS
jgi:hypothetical protein